MITFFCLYCVLYTVHLTAMAVILFHLKIYLFIYLSSNCLVIDYIQLLPLLCIILVLEMYSRFVDAIINMTITRLYLIPT
jgi:hypothetical protein